jgi:integrase
MSRRHTFQAGTVQPIETNKGKRWVLRYNKDGKRKALTIGTEMSLPTKADALREAARLMPGLTDNRMMVHTFGHLAAKYETDELGLTEIANEEVTLRNQTVLSYKSQLRHIKERWSDVPLEEMLIDLMAIQNWLRDLKTFPTEDRVTRGKFIKGRPGRPLSKKSKQSVKALLHRMINCAMKWGYMPRQVNPIALIEIKTVGIQPRKRLKIPLTLNQFFKLMADKNLEEHVKVMSKLCLYLGLRISEVLGLKWDKIDLEAGTILIELSSVGKNIHNAKTAASDTILPLHQYLVETLIAWRSNSVSKNGWVFESFATGRPFHRDALQADHLAPAGSRNAIINLGWHTFRHTHVTLLRAEGIPSEVQMMLMRHADIRTTNEYGRDDGSLTLKREANTKLIEAILGKKGN